MLIAQITDMHIRRKGDLLHHMIHTGRELRRAVAALNDFVPRPHFVVATGDLVDRGKSKEYRRLRAILDQLAMPYFLVAGNHDDHAGLREEFADHGYLPRSGPLSYVVETRPVRLVVIDTTRGRSHGGGLDAARRSSRCIIRRSTRGSRRSTRIRFAGATRSPPSSHRIHR